MTATATQTTLEERLNSLGFLTYDEYLESSHWLSTRLRWQAAGMPEECLICHRPDYCLHHRSYESLGEEPVGHLVALCDPHHYEVHRLLRKRMPGVTLWDAHLHYRKEQHMRRRGRPKTFQEVATANIDTLFAFDIDISRR